MLIFKKQLCRSSTGFYLKVRAHYHGLSYFSRYVSTTGSFGFPIAYVRTKEQADVLLSQAPSSFELSTIEQDELNHH